MPADAVVSAPHQVSYDEYRLGFPAERHSVRVVRASLRAMCSAWCVPREVADTMLLLACEVVTNAIAVSEGEVLRFTARRVLDYLYFDCNDYAPDVPAAPSMPDAEELSGRGLALVKGLSSSFGWKRLPGEQGKVCWFTLAAG